jgi:beta-fructofuranosidase
LLLLLVSAAPASALVRFDFEQKYFRHPGRQVWDFSIIRSDAVYHIFYHSIHETTPSATAADTIWHATSADLQRWELRGPVLVTAGAASWEQGALWAPSVVRDDDQDRWVMLYTGSDAAMNQRIGLAVSADLDTWTRVGGGPVISPDTTAYIWSSAASWSDFRDPFLYRQDGKWQVLVTARKLLNGVSTGVLYHGASEDLLDWADLGPIFVNDGLQPGRVLESAQYRVLGDWHHLLFGEFNATGVTIV